MSVADEDTTTVGGWYLYAPRPADSQERGFEHVQLDDGWFECFAYKHRISRANYGTMTTPATMMVSRLDGGDWMSEGSECPPLGKAT